MLSKNLNIRCTDTDLKNLRRLQELAQIYGNNSIVSQSDVIRYLINHAIYDKDFAINCGTWASSN